MHQYYIDIGIQGFWNDINQPAVFNEQKTIDDKGSNRILFRDDDGITVEQPSNKYVSLTFGYQLSQGSVECHLFIHQVQFQPEWKQIEIGLPLAWKGQNLVINGIDFIGNAIVDGMSVGVSFVVPAHWL